MSPSECTLTLAIRSLLTQRISCIFHATEEAQCTIILALLPPLPVRSHQTYANEWRINACTIYLSLDRTLTLAIRSLLTQRTSSSMQKIEALSYPQCYHRFIRSIISPIMLMAHWCSHIECTLALAITSLLIFYPVKVALSYPQCYHRYQ